MNITIEIFTTKRKERFKWLKKIIAAIFTVLGIGMFASAVYESHSLFGIENDVIRYLLAVIVTIGWLILIRDAVNYLKK